MSRFGLFLGKTRLFCRDFEVLIGVFIFQGGIGKEFYGAPTKPKCCAAEFKTVCDTDDGLTSLNGRYYQICARVPKIISFINPRKLFPKDINPLSAFVVYHNPDGAKNGQDIRAAKGDGSTTVLIK